MPEFEKVSNPGDSGEPSRLGLQHQSSQESLRKKRSRESMIIEARRMSQIIDETEDPRKILEEIKKRRKELVQGYQSHPEQQRDPGRTERILRKLTLHSEIPRAKRSGDITKEITNHATKIYNVLNKGKAPSLSHDQLEDITYLMELAVTQSDRTIRNRKDGAKPDTRSSKEMNDELEKYRDLANNLGEWVKFLECKGKAPEIYSLPVTEKLITSFGTLFPDAAKLVKESPPAMKLVQEAAMAGVKFGGYTDQGPGKAYRPGTDDNRACTNGKHVYVPRVQTDPFMAMRDFLFELTNGIHDPQFEELREEAEKGSLKRDDYACKICELEIEGSLRIGEMWPKMKKAMEEAKKDCLEKDNDAYERIKREIENESLSNEEIWSKVMKEMKEWSKHPTNLAKYDNEFWLNNYKDFKNGKTIGTLARLKMDVPYPDGRRKGETPRQRYSSQYDELVGHLLSLPLGDDTVPPVWGPNEGSCQQM